MSASGVTLSLLLLLLVSANALPSYEANLPQLTNGSSLSEKIEPLMKPLKVVEMRMVFNESRRKLGGFQICALCTCCGGARGVCLPSPCCYAINCNLPNRPFGYCSFTPKTCNCFGCHI